MKDWTNESVKLLLKENRSSNAVETVRRLSRKMVLEAMRSGWEGPPYDMFELAGILGHEVAANSGIPDARIVSKNKSTATIEYNPNQPFKRINFSIAHEIGHTLFSDFDNAIRNRHKAYHSDEWELEYLCNVAASELLLPYGAMHKERVSLEHGLEDILDLSNRYNASLESTLLRFTETTKKAECLIVGDINSEGEISIQYVHASPSWTDFPSSSINIPEGSCVHECSRPGWTSFGYEKWASLSSKRLRVSAIGLRELKSVKSQRVAIVIGEPSEGQFLETRMQKVRGDALAPRGQGERIIAQVVNYQGGLGAGFGKAMATKYPLTRRALKEWKMDRQEFRMGNNQLLHVESGVHVMQMLAQNGFSPKRGKTPLDYFALQLCLEDLRNAALSISATVHMPFIGAGQAGGNWDVIEAMVMIELVEHGVDVVVYALPGHKKPEPKQVAPTLFD